MLNSLHELYVQAKIFTMKTSLSKEKIHLILIIIGMIFTIIPLFQTNIWFDESYSVSLASHSFSQIWAIDIHDVHPVFYYDCLHVLYLIFGTNIQVYRLFSWACLSLMGIFGYTGVRKEVNTYGYRKKILLAKTQRQLHAVRRGGFSHGSEKRRKLCGSVPDALPYDY